MVHSAKSKKKKKNAGLNGKVKNFSVGHVTINVSDIQKYLIKKHNIVRMSG